MKKLIAVMLLLSAALWPLACGKSLTPTSTSLSNLTPTATVHVSGYYVSTLAGQTSSGYIDAVGVAAKFDYPHGCTVDSAGNVYVADLDNNVIRKINPTTGAVTTIAGSGSGTDSDNANALLAGFNGPHFLAVDSNQNIYVTDTYGDTIRVITAGGAVSTLAGSGSQGSSNNSNGLLATFHYPYGIAVDGSGNVYVTDANNNLLREISPTGSVSTLAGSGSQSTVDGTGTSASFDHPTGLRLDNTGNYLYVSDTYSGMIRKVTISSGAVTTLAGGGYGQATNGIGNAAKFDEGQGLATDKNGNIYYADRSDEEIRMITPAGVVTTVAGNDNGGDRNGPGYLATFSNPMGVAVDSNGVIYVSDSGNNLIRNIVYQQ